MQFPRSGKNPYFFDDEDITWPKGRTENIFTLPECTHGEMVRAFHLELKPCCTSERCAPVCASFCIRSTCRCVCAGASYRVAGCLEDEEDHGVSEHRITLLCCQPRKGYKPFPASSLYHLHERTTGNFATFLRIHFFWPNLMNWRTLLSQELV